MNAINPTQRTYKTLDDAYRFFNERLFNGRLPGCLITMQRKKGTKGYFSSEKFSLADNSSVTDEIALNPATFRDCTAEDVLSTLVHEMTHLEQHHFGKPARGRYHNEDWAQLMLRVGLVPSDTGLPGGKQTGQQVTHYIDADGPFARTCAELLKTGFDPLYGDAVTDTAAQKKKAASKTKYTCRQCGLNAWAKPNAKLICETCRIMLAAEGSEGAAIAVQLPARIDELKDVASDLVQQRYRQGVATLLDRGADHQDLRRSIVDDLSEKTLAWDDVEAMALEAGRRDVGIAFVQVKGQRKRDVRNEAARKRRTAA